MTTILLGIPCVGPTTSVDIIDMGINGAIQTTTTSGITAAWTNVNLNILTEEWLLCVHMDRTKRIVVVEVSEQSKENNVYLLFHVAFTTTSIQIITFGVIQIVISAGTFVVFLMTDVEGKEAQKIRAWYGMMISLLIHFKTGNNVHSGNIR
ncbi:hypothetical protein CHS0354_036271 [Potamilus streckersoni]|uniref:Uncharacterized protein n=1 Tax=Potamilus streckersoni TaxID=2493646 RepID=A0AAE0W3C2_9BIVA|nr:hypothetical protein CHS0354_036271 [Potamilus streckersoni]